MAIEWSGKGRRGFAAMDPEKARAIRRLGGQTAQRIGKGHTFTPEEARQAGKKGGQAISQNRGHMAEIGRRGGENSRRSRLSAKNQSSQKS